MAPQKKKVQRCRIARDRGPIDIATAKNYAARKFSHNKAAIAHVGWRVTSSCLNHILSKFCSSIASQNSRLSYNHIAPNFHDSLAAVLFRKVRSNHTCIPNSPLNNNFFFIYSSLFNYTRILGALNVAISLIHITLSRKCASSQKNFFYLEKSTYRHTYIRRFEWPTGFSCSASWTLYGYRWEAQARNMP